MGASREPHQQGMLPVYHRKPKSILSYKIVHPVLWITLGGRCGHYSPYIDGKMEAQRG
jgi:hypothetical protein